MKLRCLFSHDWLLIEWPIIFRRSQPDDDELHHPSGNIILKKYRITSDCLIKHSDKVCRRCGKYNWALQNLIKKAAAQKVIDERNKKKDEELKARSLKYREMWKKAQ